MQRIKQIDKRTGKIKRDLEQIDEMCPGSISLQYQDAEIKSYPYHQLNSVVGAKKAIRVREQKEPENDNETSRELQILQSTLR